MTRPRNLGCVFAAHAGSDRPAVIDLLDEDRPRALSHRELDRACNAMAAGLAARGLGRGDRVAICAVNRLEYLVALFGAMRAGCVPVMVNIKLPEETVRFILADSGSRIVFADGDFAPEPPSGVAPVSFDGPEWRAFTTADPVPPCVPEPGDIAEQPYTSGSTGRPKGVLLDHEGQCWMIDRLVETRELRADDASVISAPLYHKNALLAVKSALAAGGSIVLFARFDARRYIRAIAEFNLTMLTGVPTMYALILQEKELLAGTDLSSVRACSMGSAPASDNLLDSLAQTFPGAALNLNYGITEGGPIVFSWKHPAGLARPRMTVGYPIEGVELRLVGGPGPDEGTLQVRSPGVMAGYHNLPEDTARVLAGGWLDTGDVLRRDSDGWYYFVGRVDDMFVTAGENIYPGAVEAMLERHPDIMQAVVVPAPNALKGACPLRLRGRAAACRDRRGRRQAPRARQRAGLRPSAPRVLRRRAAAFRHQQDRPPRPGGPRGGGSGGERERGLSSAHQGADISGKAEGGDVDLAGV